MWYYSVGTYPLNSSSVDADFDTETRTCQYNVPGCKRDTFKLTLIEDELKVGYTDNKGVARRTNFHLPDDTDLTQVSASLEDGVLTIHCPQLESAKPRTITLK